MARRILGYIFIALAFVLTIGAMAALPAFIAAIGQLFRIFSGKIDAYDVGYLTGQLLTWAMYFFLVFLLWKYGRKFTRKTPSPKSVVGWEEGQTLD